MAHQGEDQLLARVAGGDIEAGQRLMAQHRARLRQMIRVRLDARLSSRLDPSDVLQEVFAEASQKLPHYARLRPLPFYPWLRRIAWERLIKLHQRHLYAAKRSAARDTHLPVGEESSMMLAQRLADPGTSPSQHVARHELQLQIRAAMDLLSQSDQELLILRYLEQLPMADIAAVLEITEGAVKVRHLRALERLRRLLANADGCNAEDQT